MAPEFSVIIPAYNRAGTLGRAIESILNQTYAAKEIIVVDDGSDDQTGQLIKKYPQVNYYYQNNKGVSAARNKGAYLAKYDWLIFLDSDDELTPSALSDISVSIQRNPLAKFIKARLSLFDNGSEIVIPNNKGGGCIPGSFAILSKVFREIGGYDESLKFAENTELVFRLEQNGVFPYHSEDIVLRYHQNPDGGSRNLLNMRESIVFILQKHEGKLNDHVRYLYHQNLGVIEMRLGGYPAARLHLWESTKLKPYKIKTLIRLFLTFLPFLAKKIYPLNTGMS